MQIKMATLNVLKYEIRHFSKSKMAPILQIATVRMSMFCVYYICLYLKYVLYALYYTLRLRLEYISNFIMSEYALNCYEKSVFLHL